MNEYSYKGFNSSGEQVNGRLYAKDRGEALSTLINKESLAITRLHKQGAGNLVIELKRKPSDYQLSIFASQLGILLDKGINVVKALDAVRQQSAENRMLRESAEDIYASVVQRSEGVTKAFGKHLSVFGERFVAMVKVGEESGKMGEVFKLLGKQLKERSELKAAVQGGLVYPTIQLVVALAVTILMMVTVVPMMEGLLRGLGADLPPLTKLVLGITHFLREDGLWLVIGLGLLGYAVSRYGKTREGALNLDRLKLQVLGFKVFDIKPFKVFEDVVRKAIIADYAQSMALTTASTSNIYESFALSRASVTSPVYREALVQIEKMATDGEKTLDQCFAHYRNLFKPDFIAILESGVETGSLPESFQNIAEIYMQQVKQSAESISKAIEPLLIVFMGLFIGTIIYSLFEPFVKITQTVLNKG